VSSIEKSANVFEYIIFAGNYHVS